MEVETLAIPEVKILRPKRHGDSRGYFSEVYNMQTLAALGITATFVQDNQSLSRDAGTVRGLHFQSDPRAQAKLVRVLRGRIFDVAVDIRRASPTFGQWVAAELSAEAWNQMFVPAGFAHGFCTLEPDTEVVYKVTDFYAPDNDHGLTWDDPDLGIDWPVDRASVVLSDRDSKHPRLRDQMALFA